MVFPCRSLVASPTQRLVFRYFEGGQTVVAGEQTKHCSLYWGLGFEFGVVRRGRQGLRDIAAQVSVGASFGTCSGTPVKIME